MTSKAHTRFNPMLGGIDIAVTRSYGRTPSQFLRWTQPEVHQPTEAEANSEDPGAWLTLDEHDARAIYEALGDHFGHAGHDIRALRRDYDAERGRVDKLINHLVDTPTRAHA